MVAATPGNPQILKRKIAGFGIGLQACATGWQRPGKPLFLPGTGWNTTEGKGSFHAHATPQNRAQKKRDSQRNADHKKDFAPRSEKKPAFLVGRYSWRSTTLWGKSFVYARKLPQKSAQKKEQQASWFVYHGGVRILGGISLPLYAGKVCETGHIKKAENAFTLPAFLNSTTGSAAACSSRSRTGRG